MRILQIHNFYRRPGGEDQVVAAEAELLTKHGHSVEQYQVHNDEIDTLPSWDVALKTLWNAESHKAVQHSIDSFQPDVVHSHNTFPLISPSVYYAAASQHVPVIQTLHNFRLICLGSTLFRNGHVCEDCLQSIAPYPGIVHRCYRGSLGASAASAAMLTAHQLAGTWTRKVQTYIALTEAAKSKFVKGGLPAGKIVVKSNFVSQDPGLGTGAGKFVLFLGRLCEEKGIRALLDAWKRLPEIPLKIAGDGPLRELVVASSRSMPQIHWLGHCDHAEALRLLKDAFVLVVPSVWYEGAVPLTVIEATACGTPVILSDLGSMGEWAAESGLGMPFVPGDAVGLAEQVNALSLRSRDLAGLRTRMRQHYLAHYTAEQNYQQLMTIYQDRDRPGAATI